VSELLTSAIEIRNSAYTVREMTGKEMQAVRKMILSDSEKFRVQAYVASICCVSPKFANEQEAANASQAVLKAISDEAFRLTQGEEEKKADAPGNSAA
jgi:hypothetical protein